MPGRGKDWFDSSWPARNGSCTTPCSMAECALPWPGFRFAGTELCYCLQVEEEQQARTNVCLQELIERRGCVRNCCFTQSTLLQAPGCPSTQHQCNSSRSQDAGAQGKLANTSAGINTECLVRPTACS